jgi:hypothetical protein
VVVSLLKINMTEQEARKYILELFKIVSTTSILVVNQYGRVKRINCPFRVIALEDIPPDILTGDFYQVEAVKMALDLKEVFIIKENGYYIRYFQII